MPSGISNPVVKWNGQTLSVGANSVSYKLGKGDKVTRPFSAGGDAIEVVTTDNVETKISMLKFSLANTANAASIAQEMSNNLAENEFEVSEGDLIVTFTGMVLTTEPEVPLSQDGVIELDFSGLPASLA